MSTPTPEYYKLYTEAIDFSLLPPTILRVISKTFARGSPAGFFAEDFIADLYRDITDHDIQSKGYDLISKANARKIEVKGFNSNGTDLLTSGEKGKGRVAKGDWATVALDKDFIVADTSGLVRGCISYIILPGSYVAQYPSKTSMKKRARLFEPGLDPIPVVW